MSIVKTPKPKNTKPKADSFVALPTVSSVQFADELVTFVLSDKRMITLPVCWIPKLDSASPVQRRNYTVRGHFVFWDELDEIIGVKNLLNGSIVPNK